MRHRFGGGLISAVTLTSLVTGCTGSAPSPSVSPSHVAMTATPATALLDSSTTVLITGLPAGARTTVLASARDYRGVTWSSAAIFIASVPGSVSLSQRSVGGVYTGRDPMGLFDLMTPPPGNPSDTIFGSRGHGYTVTLRAMVRGRTVATATTRRINPDADIVTRQFRVASSGIYGEFARARATSGPKPAVLVFGGSEGGLSTSFVAEMLAAHGYPALALAYFAEPGLPRALSGIPLEYFTAALHVLRRQTGVDPRHVLVFGDSRGSEAALLLGADIPSLIDGVIAGVPSSVVNRSFPGGRGAAWTRGGAPVPTVGIHDFGSTTPSNSRAVIPVERIKGPILTVCGEDDAVWDSCSYAAAITARRKSRHVPFADQAISYAGAGHYVGGMTCCYSVTPSALAPGGGSAQATQAARRDAWTRLLAFLAAQ